MEGRIQVYTGCGKGKTTAAIGLAVRAACSGMSVFFGQFMKGRDYSELCLQDRFPDEIRMEQFGTPRLICKGEKPRSEDLKKVSQGLARLREAMLSGDYDLVVADEINVTVHMGLLNEEKVLSLIRARPSDVELVLTGRYAPDSFIEAADLVTDMKEIKHYYRTMGLRARKGIES